MCWYLFHRALQPKPCLETLPRLGLCMALTVGSIFDASASYPHLHNHKLFYFKSRSPSVWQLKRGKPTAKIEWKVWWVCFVYHCIAILLNWSAQSSQSILCASCIVCVVASGFYFDLPFWQVSVWQVFFLQICAFTFAVLHSIQRNLKSTIFKRWISRLIFYFFWFLLLNFINVNLFTARYKS